MKKIFYLLLPLLLLNSCHVGRFFYWNFADARDYKKFPSRPLEKSTQPFHFKEVANKNLVKLPKEIELKGKKYTFDQAMEKSGTLAFLVIRNDSLLHEKYYFNYDTASIVPSFSVAKSFVSALMGIAIDEGYIKSVKEPITNYLSDLDKTKFGNITIEHVLNMRSGIEFNESYFNPFGDVARYYYGLNLKKYINKHKVGQPDQNFDYISLNTQLLGLIIEKATGQKLYDYLQAKIWQPLGMEYDASWSIDSKKHDTVKAFCCINARARDFAKFGRLYLHNGNWNGQQIVSADWVRQSTVFEQNINNFIYSYQWWHNVDVKEWSDTLLLNGPHRIVDGTNANNERVKYAVQPANDYFAEGILGQFVYVNPAKNIIIVRLGKKYGNIGWGRFCKAIAEQN
ncbi:MAG: serine hydrolase domain-containing protein [Saprospiraceae bacterium]